MSHADPTARSDTASHRAADMQGVALGYEPPPDERGDGRIWIPAGGSHRVDLGSGLKARLLAAVLGHRPERRRVKPQRHAINPERRVKLVLLGAELDKLGLAERAALRARVAFLPAGGGLLSSLNAWENIVLSLGFHYPRRLQGAAAQVHGLLTDLRADPHVFLHKLPERMSQYEKKLAGYVRILIEKPELLLIHFYAADAFGINRGMAVRLFGLPVGNVSNMDIADRGVKVELSIISEYTPRLPKNSRARLVREGYIGAANIQIVPANEPGRRTGPVAEGDEIEFIPARGMAELIDDFKTQVTPVINDLRRMIAEMNQPNGDFRESLAGANTVFQQLPGTNRELRQVLGSAARVSAQLEQQLPLLTGKLGTTLDSLSETAVQIRDATRKNGDALHEALVQVPGLLRDGGDLVREGQDVVGAARNSWLIRDNIETRSVRTLPVDSFEAANPGSVPAQAQR